VNEEGKKTKQDIAILGSIRDEVH